MSDLRDPASDRSNPSGNQTALIIATLILIVIVVGLLLNRFAF